LSGFYHKFKSKIGNRELNLRICVSRRHPIQKPVAMTDYLFNTFSNSGAVVLDNTMGPGSAGMAALQVGRKFVGGGDRRGIF
jgi:site-specific DNA-methyltransferase (adenine-specific)